MSVSNCMSVVERLPDADQNELLDRVERLQTEEGVGPNKAAVEVATAMLADLENQAFMEPVRSVAREVTQTDEFKRWFGDSKVVDADGKPLVVYHGTTADFSVFDAAKIKRKAAGTGFYFTTDRAQRGYADGEGASVMPVYLSIQNPTANPSLFRTDESYDGLIFPLTSTPGVTHIAVRRPEQIKSAIGNSGAFDPADPDITRSAARKPAEDLYLDQLYRPPEGFRRRDASYPRNVGSMSGVYARLKSGSEAKKLTSWLNANDATHRYHTEIDQTQDAKGWTRVIQTRADGEPLRGDEIVRSAARPEFFSQLERVVAGVPAKMATMAAPQWKLWLDANAPKLGVKKDEIEWSGIKDYLDLQGKTKVSSEQLQAYLRDNGVRVQDTVLGATTRSGDMELIEVDRRSAPSGDYITYNTADGVWEVDLNVDSGRAQVSRRSDDDYGDDSDFAGSFDGLDQAKQFLRGELRALEREFSDDDLSRTKYRDYTVPGGDNYREVLITLPGAKANMRKQWALLDPRGDTVSVRSEPPNQRWLDEVANKGYSIEERSVPDAQANARQGAYTSSHWDQPNILAHLRVDDRTDADGNKVLFINEIQSDWGQDGKKKGIKSEFKPTTPEVTAKVLTGREFVAERSMPDAAANAWLQGRNDIRNDLGKPPVSLDDTFTVIYEDGIPKIVRDGAADPEAAAATHRKRYDAMIADARRRHELDQASLVPSAPFISDTKAWAGLALKRAIMMAVEGGYDRVALITGQQAADLYDLSKQVDMLSMDPAPGGYNITAWKSDEEVASKIVKDEAEAADMIGKEPASKLFARKDDGHVELTGVDLNVGGEGMRAFYDQIIPQVARDVLKKLGGGQLQSVFIPGADAKPAEAFRVGEDGKGGYAVIWRSTGEQVSNHATREEAKEAMRQRRLGEAVEQPGFDITPAMREKVEAGVPLFSKRRPDPIESAENFKRWSNGAPLVTSAAADDYAFRTGQKVVVEAYHGTARGDRVGDVFQRSRATSGPMAFFTSDPALASSYATGKRDTSLTDEHLEYSGWFKYQAPGMRSSVSIDRAWSMLPNDVRDRIAKRMPDIRTDDSDQIVYEEGGGDIGSYQWNLQQTRRGSMGGNPLAAAVETWLTSGALFGEEQRFMDVLRLAGMPMKDTQYDSPNDAFPFIYKAYVRMNSPLVTGDIPETFEQALRQAAAKDRSRARFSEGVDSWDKNTRTLRSWADQYFNPPTGDNRFVWTSIPDKVTELIKSLGYDGIIDYSGKGGGTVHPVYIPTTENQVKSAIGNNGKYSTARSILRSADRASRLPRDLDQVRLAGGYTLGDMMKSSKQVSWWDKTVGSMFNLAEKQPEFKRVYDEVQDFIGDISKYATRAADLAPTILPQLETLADIARRPLSVEDTKALSAPVFEGTLMFKRDEEGNPVRTDDVGAAGVVWREEELRTLYGLDDRQIGLYREVRRAINKSLTDLSITDMLRYAGKDADGVRNAVLQATTANQAAQILAQEFERLAEIAPERRSVLDDSARGVKEKANLTHGLIAKGYAPLSRYGDYTVYVTKDGGKEQVFFGMYETEREANKAARAWRDAEPDADVKTGTMSKESYKLFKGVTPETLGLFGESLGLEEGATDRESQVFQAYLKAAKTNRSAMKRMIERKGVAGYSEDVGRVLAGFVYSNARQASTNLHAGSISKAAADIKAGDLKDHAVRLVEYVQNPAEEAQTMRGLLFANYIGGSVASALVNLTQTATTTWPVLSQHYGVAKSAAAINDAIRVAAKGAGSDTDLADAMKRAEEEGITAPQETHNLQAQAAGRAALSAGDGTSVGNFLAKAGNAKNKIMLVWGKAFGWAEQMNRKIAFAAAYKLSRDRGDADPFAFAKKTVAETQYTMNKGNNQVWARGAVGATLFTFRKFAVNYLEGLARMWGSGPEGKRAFALSLAVMFLLAGTGGFPFAEDLEDAIDFFAQRVLGKNFQTKEAKRQFFADILGRDGAEFLTQGLSGIPGVPIDVSGRLGMGNVIPGTGLLQKKRDYGNDIKEVAGAAGDFVGRLATATAAAAQGDGSRALEEAAPTALKNVAKAIQMAQLGYYTDAKGRKVIDTTMAEAVLKGVGFQPQTVANVQQATRAQQMQIDLNKVTEGEIADLWARGRIERKPELVDEAKARLLAWNRNNPSSPIEIDAAQINRRVQQANMDKAKRIEATAPKEIRAAVRRELESQLTR